MVHLTDLTLVGAKASVEIEKAYHLFAILCHLRRPCSIPEIVSRCTLFDVSEEYVVYLCGSKGSPVCVTMSGDVSVSVDGVGSVEGLMGRAVGRYVPRVMGPGKGMGRLGIGGVSSGASWKKRKRCWEESKGCLRLPARRRRLFTDEERCQIKNIWGSGCGGSGGGGEVMEVNLCIATDLTRNMNMLTDGLSIVNYDSSTSVLENATVPLLLEPNKDVEIKGLTKVELIGDDSEAQTDKIVDSNLQEPIFTEEQLDGHGNVFGSKVPSSVLDFVQEADDLINNVVNSEVQKGNLMCDTESIGRPGLVTATCPEDHIDCDVAEAKYVRFYVSHSCEASKDEIKNEEAVTSCREADKAIDHTTPIVYKNLTSNHVLRPLDKWKANATVENQTNCPSIVYSHSIKQLLPVKKKSLSKVTSIPGPQVLLESSAKCKDLNSFKKKEHQRKDQNCLPIQEKTKKKHAQSVLPKETGVSSTSVTSNNQPVLKEFPKLESYVIEEEEGSGGYGTVYRARRKCDGKIFAIKCPHEKAHAHHVHNELKMLERFGGRNYVIKYDSCLISNNSECFVLEHVEHDRPEVLKKEMDVCQIRWYAYCLFKALVSMHKQGVVHRDVKPGNFLFSRNLSKGYLIDFNLALDLHKKYGSTGKLKKSNNVSFDHVPLPVSKSAVPTKGGKLISNRVFEAMRRETSKRDAKLSQSKMRKMRGGGDDHLKVFTDLRNRNLLNNQCADGSGVTSTKDATSTITPSAERLRQPMPSIGRKELLSIVQEARRNPNDKKASVPPATQRKRVAAAPEKMDRKLFCLSPMPLHSTGELLKNKGVGKRKKEGPCVGTKGFRAPEVLVRSPHQNFKVDVWSAGVTLLYLMIGKSPFVGDPEQNIKDIAKLRGSEDVWEVAKLHSRESSFPKELFDIELLPSIKLETWCKMNTKRPDFLELIPRSLFDLIDKCLTVNPRLRISAEEVLEHRFFDSCHEAFRRHRLLRKELVSESVSNRSSNVEA